MEQPGRFAFITGSSRGIGAATAKVLAADGYRVIIHYGRARERAEQVASEIRLSGGRADIVAGDLAQADTPQRLAEQVEVLCGGALHALVLNAGVMPVSNFVNCTPEIFDRIYTINLRAPFFLLQQLAPVLAEGASVVMLSSLTARRVTGSVAAYAAMKASIETLVQRAAAEFGERWIRVNAVAPATTATDTVAPWTSTEAGREATLSVQALKRIAQPGDVADVIAFLCSDKARWVNGAVIPVNGGSML